MTDRVHIRAELEMFVDDASALRQSAYERMRSAWSSDDEFPYESPDDVPLEQAVASALADALPIQFPGAKRSALSIDAEAAEAADSDDDKGEDDGEDDKGEDDGEDDDADSKDSADQDDDSADADSDGGEDDDK